MIPFYLLTGFLGSGKTTLLKNLLHNDIQRKWAVIQNEFAPTGVDGRELKEEASSDFYLEEINNGSVFCVCQMGNFISLLKQIIHERRPDAIVLEASGLSDPFSIVEILQHNDLSAHLNLAGVITVVDAVNYERSIKMLERVRHQVRIADLVLLNKIDLTDSSALDRITESIQELNPLAEVRRTSYCDVITDFFTVQNTSLDQLESKTETIDPDNRPGIKTGVYRTHDCLSPNVLDAWMNEMGKRCIRFKGYMKLDDGTCILAQSVFGKNETRPCKAFDGRSEIVGIGEDLDIRVIRSIFINYL